MAFEVEAIFHFIARNPPSILLGGGILMYILGSLYVAIGKTDAATPLLNSAPWVVGIGVLLQFLWLFRHEIGAHI